MPLKHKNNILLQLAFLLFSLSSIAQTPCDINFELHPDSLLISDNNACLPLNIGGSHELSEVTLSFTFNNIHLKFSGITILKSGLESLEFQTTEQGDETILQIEWSSVGGLIFADGESLFEICLEAQSLNQQGFDILITGEGLPLGNSAISEGSDLNVCTNIGRIETPCSLRKFEISNKFALNNKDRCRILIDTTTVLYPFEDHDSIDFPITFRMFKNGILDFEKIYEIDDSFRYSEPPLISNGPYTLILENSIGCLDTATFQVVEVDNSGQFGDNITGFGSHVITHTCKGIDDGAIWEEGFFFPGDIGRWSNGVVESFLANNRKFFQISDLEPGIYSLGRQNPGSENNCIATAYYEVLNIPTYQVDYNTRFATCDGSNGSIWIETDPPGNYQYIWEGRSDTTALIDNLSPGIYNVTIINPEGCEVERSIDLPMTGFIHLEWEDEVNFPNCNPETMASRSVNLQSDNIIEVDFIWSSGESTTGTSSIAAQLESGRQWVYASTSTCESDTMYFDVPDVPEFGISIDSSSSTFEACISNTARIQLDYPRAIPPVVLMGDIDIGWQFDLPPGEHELMVISANGCEQRWNIIIDETELQKGIDFEFTVPDVNGLCPGEIQESQFLSFQEDIIELNFNGSTILAGDDIPFEIGEHEILITNAQGCVWDTVISVMERQLDISVPPDLEIDRGRNFNIVLFQNPVTDTLMYNWTAINPWSCALDDCKSIDYTALESETIYIEVSDDSGCTYHDSIVITVIDTMMNDTISMDTMIIDTIPKISSEVNFYIPNAINLSSSLNSVFCITGDENLQSVTAFRLFDRWGNVVASDMQPQHADSWCLTYPTSLIDLVQGVYVYSMRLTFIDGTSCVVNGDVLILL